MKINIIINDSGLKSPASKVISAKLLKKELKVLNKEVNNFLNIMTHLKNKTTKHVFINLHLCGKSKMRKLNKDYRNKDKVTDVLSFPLYEKLRSDKKSKDLLLANIDLGDIVICKEKCIAQSKEFNISPKEEFIHLFIHGFLHLLGYDHEINKREEKLMEKMEEDLTLNIYKKLKKAK